MSRLTTRVHATQRRGNFSAATMKPGTLYRDTDPNSFIAMSAPRYLWQRLASVTFTWHAGDPTPHPHGS